nr:SCAN domain-containing protein 3-like [Parasteatoda tepidariorum]
MDAEYRCLLLYTEIRWLSRGKSLLRVFELREPLQRFLLEKKSPLAAHFSDKVWVTKLAYLCDIFNLLNELNLCLQGKMTTVFKLADKVAAFKAKLELWGRRVNRGIFDMFQTLAAAAMTGRLSGLTARIKEVAPESEATHCLIHREVLASRKMSPEFNNVLIDVVKVINYIKAHALNSRLFEQLCEEMDAEYRCLLLYTEIRWLSRGKSLLRVFELREPLQ